MSYPIRRSRAFRSSLSSLILPVTILATVMVVASNRISHSADLNPAACSIPNFTGPAKTTLSSPRAIAVADFNKDTKPDIATASHFSNNVSILLGNGSGGFSGPTNFALQPAVASHPIFLVSADLNGDGNADLVSANEDGSRAVSVLLGNGTGGFGAGSSFINVSFAKTSSVALGDVNGDSKLDLAVTNADPFAQRIIVATGDGTGQFSFLRNLSSGGLAPSQVVMRDINGDTKIDLIVANATSPTGTVSVLLGDGAGDFSAATTFDVGTSPVSMAVEDFSGDGKLDLAVANQGSNNMSVLLGNGSGSFSPPTNFSAGGTGPQSVVTADFNGDGKTDLALSNTRPGSVVIFLGDGAGGFVASANFSTGGPLFIGSSRHPAAVADFNSDLRPDLAFANESQQGAFILLNDCGSSPATQIQLNNAAYLISEFDGNTAAGNSLYVVSVTRTGDITGTASVDYLTTNGTAVSPQDYSASLGTLMFSPGETLKIVSIPITNDEIPEELESFDLTLSNVVGAASLSNPSSASISIDDDDFAFVQFSSGDANLSEGAGSPSVVVTRSGNLVGTGTVNYATSDTAGASNCSAVNHVASSRCDYITTIGTLHFGLGETSKSIPIPVIDDSYAEGGEGLTVTLSNPTGPGFRIGGGTSKSASIIDNDTVDGPNPLDTVSFFVRQHYLDFLNREPDTDGFNFWTNQITSCGADAQCIEVRRIHVSASFFLSIEFQDTGYLVERLYKVSYGDATGDSTIGPPHTLTVPIVRFNEFLTDTQKLAKGVIVGQPGWENVLETNKQTLVAEFVQRTRFANAFPTALSPAVFVDAMFTNAGVTPTTTDRSDAINEFSGAVNTTDLAARGRALRRVAENSILRTNEISRAFVLMQYFGYLRRNPNDPQDSDHSGYDFWLTKLNQFNGNFIQAEMVKGFLSSIEYRQRFGP